VPPEISLAVAVDVELANAAGARDGILEDAGKDGLPSPEHILRHANVDREQACGHLAGDGDSVGGLEVRSTWAR
jgi:hypothetical protein